jgi:acyl carrier protein phosphodiesterase
MNYLAHIYLSGSVPEVQVGGLLGDFVKGPLRGELPADIEAGIALHRRIDVTTDEHPLFCQLLANIPPPWRRYGGILIDVHFDHLLASEWQNYHSILLSDFCEEFYRNLQTHWPHLPARARQFCELAPQVGWLESYADRDKIPRMLDNVGKRLRKPVGLGEGWRELQFMERQLEDCFACLMSRHRKYAAGFLLQNGYAAAPLSEQSRRPEHR